MAIILPVVCFIFALKVKKESIDDEKFAIRWGSLWIGIHTEDRLSLMMTSLFLLRRALFVCILGSQVKTG